MSVASKHLSRLFHTVASHRHSQTSKALHRLFSRSHLANTGSGALSSLLHGLESLPGLNSAVSLPGFPFGGNGTSLLGTLAQPGNKGFGLSSILSTVFPLGGIVSSIASLFRSPASLPLFQQFNPPPSLTFEGVLGANGRVYQNASSSGGLSRAASLGLDLIDAEGGPRSPYRRVEAQTSSGLNPGSLVPVAGSATGRYTGTLGQSGDFGAGSAGQATLPSFDRDWFMSHANHLAAAVRSAMLDFHPIVDVVNDL